MNENSRALQKHNLRCPYPAGTLSQYFDLTLQRDIRGEETTMNIRTNRAVAVVTAAALAFTSAGIAPAFAASKPAKEVQTAQAAGATDFSSHRRRHYRNNAAGAAAFAAIVGAVGAYAAAREYRKARERSYGYYGAPYGYYGAPYDYGPRYRHW
jgi:hypothetical protein